ncbi:MAG: FKBP-type peptidyl-prolyl cis-trans isomerase [Saprospiraceae bacterium]
MKLSSILLLALGIFFTACKKDNSLTPEEQLAKDTALIQQYLTGNGLAAESTASGLHYIIEEEGSGGHPTVDNEVSVLYKGYFLDGTVFDQTQGQPITFPLSQVIAGWQEGIPLFQKGGKGVLLLPSTLAYGQFPPPGIPKNAVLIFDVELVDF